MPSDDPEIERAKVIAIISKVSGLPPETLNENTRLLQDIGMDGDDADEAIAAVARTFAMDVSEFRGWLPLAQAAALK